MYESGWLSGVEEREAERERRREREGEIVLSYDERLDWLESDDCSKWPGRWLHLCFPFSPSLIPSSLTHLLSHLHLSHSLSHSRRASLCHPLFSLVSSWQPINTAPLSLSLSLLMAQLLVLMHFKHTAAATSQSEWKDMSSSNLSNLCPFFIQSCVSVLMCCALCQLFLRYMTVVINSNLYTWYGTCGW